jgi:large subunit ribosomal protein L30
MKLKVTQVRSVIHRPRGQKQTVRRLGLHRIRDSVIKDDRPEIRGMIAKVQHLVQVEEVPGDAPGDQKDEGGIRGRRTTRERTSS